MPSSPGARRGALGLWTLHAVWTGAPCPGPGIQSIPGAMEAYSCRGFRQPALSLNGLTYLLKIPEFNYHAQHKNKRGGWREGKILMEMCGTTGPSLRWEVCSFPRLSRVDSGIDADGSVQLGTQAPASPLLHLRGCSQGYGTVLPRLQSRSLRDDANLPAGPVNEAMNRCQGGICPGSSGPCNGFSEAVLTVYTHILHGAPALHPQEIWGVLALVRCFMPPLT